MRRYFVRFTTDVHWYIYCFFFVQLLDGVKVDEFLFITPVMSMLYLKRFSVDNGFGKLDLVMLLTIIKSNVDVTTDD